MINQIPILWPLSQIISIDYKKKGSHIANVSSNVHLMIYHVPAESLGLGTHTRPLMLGPRGSSVSFGVNTGRQKFAKPCQTFLNMLPISLQNYIKLNATILNNIVAAIIPNMFQKYANFMEKYIQNVHQLYNIPNDARRVKCLSTIFQMCAKILLNLCQHYAKCMSILC